MTLNAMLRSSGHDTVDEGGDIIITDDVSHASEFAAAARTLVLVPASEVPSAVAAMQRGVYDYIFVPLQPGELDIRVQRALNGDPTNGEEGEPGELMTLEEAEQRIIEKTLRQCRNNRTEAARVLGIGRNTLWRKLKKARET